MTSLAGLGDVLTGLGDAFGRARSAGRSLYGFAEHHFSTVYLGSSTGFRLRHVQPTGKLEAVARSNGGERSAWAGVGAADLRTVHVEDLEDRLVRRLAWGERKIELDAGRYEVLLPPDAVADLVVMLGEAISGREAEEGRSVFSGAGRRDPGRRGTLDSSFFVAHRPVRTGLRVRSFCRYRVLGSGRVCLRQRPTDPTHRLDRKRPPRSSAVPPGGGGKIRRAARLRGRQPRSGAARGHGQPR